MKLSELADQLYRERPTQILYHYTSLSGLLGIVASKLLHATEVHFFSDASEMMHTASLLQLAIAQRPVTDNFATRLFDQFQQWFGGRLAAGNILCAACFSADGNLLSQWRSYCEPAKGVSLGFSPDKLLTSAEQQSFTVGRCVYELATQTALAAQILAAVELRAREKGEVTDPSKRHPDNSFHDVFEELEPDLLRIAALLKNPTFREENEWRAVSPIITNYVTSPIRYREGSSMLIPYVDFALPSAVDRRLDIERVYLGPTSHQNNSMTSVGWHLSQQGASPRSGLVNCQIPYRSW